MKYFLILVLNKLQYSSLVLLNCDKYFPCLSYLDVNKDILIIKLILSLKQLKAHGYFKTK